MPRIRLLGLVLAGALLFAGVACGGGNDGGAKATATQESPTEEADATATETTDGGPTSTSTTSTFDSYHYTVDLNVTIDDPQEAEPAEVNGVIEGDFVAPNSHSFRTNYEIGGLSATQEAVIIGEDAWYREGAGGWTATSAGDATILDMLSLTSADPGFIDDAEFASNISTLDSEEESINGVDTRRYHIPKEAIATLSGLLGEDFLQNAAGLQDFEMTVWLEDESNGLVRAEFTASAGPETLGDVAPFDVSPDSVLTIDMTINLTQINDDSIEIRPPA